MNIIDTNIFILAQHQMKKIQSQNFVEFQLLKMLLNHLYYHLNQMYLTKKIKIKKIVLFQRLLLLEKFYMEIEIM